MKRDQYNDEYLALVENQRLYFKTIKDFQEVSTNILPDLQKLLPP